MGALRITLLCSVVALCSASLSIPEFFLSPAGMPSSLTQSGLVAVKLAVGTRLLGMLGFGGLGSRFPSPMFPSNDFSLLGQSIPGYQSFPEDYRSFSDFPDGLTPKSKEFSARRGPSIPTTFNINTATPTEIENFFGILNRVDANKCISRLVCEIGAEPKMLEGLGHNVKDTISSLRVLEKNKMSKKYKDIMLAGQKSGVGSCPKTFPTCDARAYRMIRTFVRAFRVNRTPDS